MPYKPPKPCKYPGCVITTPSRQGYCEAHAHHYQPPQYPSLKDNRPSAATRGYDKNWHKSIRPSILRKHHIPPELWPLYDIHHDPPYNPLVEPDHRKYNLIPLLRSEHSFITNKTRGRRAKSLQDSSRDRQGNSNFHTAKMGGI